MTIEDFQLDDFAAFERQRQGGDEPAPAAEAELSEGAEETPQSESAADSETDEEKGEGEKPEEKKKGGFQRRIDKLTTERKQLAAENEELKRKLAGEPAAQPKSEATAAKPKPDDFTSYDDYVEKLAEWTTDQAEAKREAKRQAQEASRKAEQAQAEVSNVWQSRVKEFAATAPDFEDVLEAVDTPISPALTQALLDSEHGPAIAYELAKNTKEIERLNTLSPIAVAREIGRLEAAKAKPAAAKRTTLAPEPISPVTRGKASGHRFGDPDMSYAEYEKLANARFNRS